ncbi:hypothetical protein ACLKA6_010120 [Drosophila palustris]
MFLWASGETVTRIFLLCVRSTAIGNSLLLLLLLLCTGAANTNTFKVRTNLESTHEPRKYGSCSGVSMTSLGMLISEG